MEGNRDLGSPHLKDKEMKMCCCKYCSYTGTDPGIVVYTDRSAEYGTEITMHGSKQQQISVKTLMEIRRVPKRGWD